MGIGRGRTPKVLIRVEGPSPAPDDDAILEAKALSDLSRVRGLEDAARGDVTRVIEAAARIGRMHVDLWAVVPRLPTDVPGARRWWIRSWDPPSGEIHVGGLESAAELAEIAHDAGAQLATAGLRMASSSAQQRQQVAAQLEPRVRATARRMVAELVADWERLRRLEGRAR
jgi:hypothetical protein